MKKYIWVLVAMAMILLFTAADIFNIYVSLAFIGILLIYVFFHEQAWLLVALAPVALVFGQIIRVEVQPGWMYEISLTEIFILVAAGIFIIDLIFTSARRDFFIRKTGIWFLLYAIYGLVSYLYISDFELYIAGMKIIGLSLLSYLVALNFLTTPKRIRYFMSSLAATAIALSFQMFYVFYTTGFSSSIFIYRSYITIPIGAIALVAALIALILPVLLSYYFQLDKQDLLRPLFLVAFVIGSLGVFLTLGKAAIASLLVGLIYLFFKFKKKRIAFTLFAALFILLGYLFFSQYSQGLIERLGNIFIDKNTKFRVEEYVTDFKIIKDHLWIGVGEGQQLAYYQRYISQDYRQWVNNYLIQVLIDLGLIGLVIYLAIVAFIVKALKNITQLKQPIYFGLAASLLVMFINGLFEVTLFALPYAVIAWLLVGLVNRLDQAKLKF